jgi:hypothetical protein
MQEIEIRLKGHIDANWSGWLGHLSTMHLDTGDTLLRGYVRDQAALYGLIERLSSLGLELHSVVCKKITTDKGQGASTGPVTR